MLTYGGKWGAKTEKQNTIFGKNDSITQFGSKNGIDCLVLDERRLFREPNYVEIRITLFLKKKFFQDRLLIFWSFFWKN